MHQWQVAAGLIYGQVKKSYRRRKLIRVTHVMRLETETALKVARPRTWPLRTAEYRFYRAGESDRPSWSGSIGTSHLGYGEARPTTPDPPRVVASLLSRMSRPHASLRVALVQPRARGGRLLAQRYRQRTEALAAGRTNRQWSTREVLCYRLPPVPCLTM